MTWRDAHGTSPNQITKSQIRQSIQFGYWASPQKGQRSVRAWSGLRQCQQKRGCGVSRALSRLWMSSAPSVSEGVGRGVGRAGRRRALSTAKKGSLARALNDVILKAMAPDIHARYPRGIFGF